MMEARQLFEEANRRYWNELESIPIPRFFLFPYDLVDEVREGNWPFLIERMVSGELLETINLMNAWQCYLFDWSIWAKILPTFDDNDRWTLQLQHVGPLAFTCMYQPSAMRDRFCMVATNALHQANLIVLPGYEDRLDQDNLRTGRFLNRGQKENQLVRIGKPWARFGELQTGLQAINTADYQRVTRNFRNQASHALAPRFEIGETNTVVRYMAPKEKMVAQPDGTFALVQDVTRMVVHYGFGGTPPLKYETIVAENQKQHALGADTLKAYQTLLKEVLQKIGIRTGTSASRSRSATG